MGKRLELTYRLEPSAKADCNVCESKLDRVVYNSRAHVLSTRTCLQVLISVWLGSSVGQSASLSRQRSWVRAPSESPTDMPLQLSWQSRGLKIPVSLVRFRPEAPHSADLAHLVERHLAKVEVAGSSPVIRSKKSGHASVRIFTFYLFTLHFSLKFAFRIF